MEFATMNLSHIHILRVDPGEDVLEAIKRFLQDAGLRQAVVLGGYGTLAGPGPGGARERRALGVLGLPADRG